MRQIGRTIAIVSTVLVIALYIFDTFETRHYHGNPVYADRLAMTAEAKALNTRAIEKKDEPIKESKIDDKLTKLDDFNYNNENRNKTLDKILTLTREPIALVNTGKLYVSDREGHLMENVALLTKYNLPVISDLNIFVDSKRGKIVSEHVSQGLELLGIIRDFDYALYQRISEIKWHEQLGMIAYLNDSGLPVIIGIGGLYRKVAYLSAVLPEIEGSSLLEQALYLDVRIKNQVILKKRA